MDEKSLYDELVQLVEAEGPKGLTDELEAEIRSRCPNAVDGSDGNAMMKTWWSESAPDLVEVYAISMDGIHFDFTVTRYVEAETRLFDNGGVD